MATWPANTETDWNTKMLAYLAIEHETDGTHKENATYSLVDSVRTKIFTKYFTGTLDADTSTVVAHGVTGGADKILHVSAGVWNGGTAYLVTDFRGQAESATLRFDLTWGTTNVTIDDVGTTLQSQKYRIKIDYIA